jgi:hypothetical protein
MKLHHEIQELHQLESRMLFVVQDDCDPPSTGVFQKVYQVMEHGPGVSVYPEKILVGDFDKGIVWAYNKDTKVRRVLTL